uniref:Solute-binding protein family 3/N-terminal domain-containing protein n=1 Tax=Coccolithus braarudii TaxID=221442 RepID=A0A6T7GP04_9EUKA|mmetsp:Transcript_34191/g.73011  ORF Transcript_34191/g.73011 Transcript_34191/m.73011 type:complete len:347 (-) Transcript_34191:208-1248(-)|eukprot:CAMPEP_0183332230 /NCGR_PEP_ID=MMETSP0164_2-20130417/1447_1 /TAXON_ID=221442 /ORGANISM="Coccolithus pelagicus ssp braarudi, Strain PLY182g" /LENGTH=346 /DNA_ID=CAMNT_0025500903 /DNA_START=43 /DNA_END=1083 /DNA_ORIENTATION=+
MLMIASALVSAFASAGPACDAAYEPPVPGIMPGSTKPSILLGQDIDWPPYAYIAMPPEGELSVAGFGHDVAKGLSEVCDIDVEVTQADWAGCWNSNKIGADAKAGVYHGCMTYTHTYGARNRWMDFSHAILQDNKPGGILTRLVDGVPLVKPNSDLSGKKVVDVDGWAPTADTLDIEPNVCTGQSFTGYTFVAPSGAALNYTNANDQALATLLSGAADVMWVYADHAFTYSCTDRDVDPTWDCELWSGFGTEFAYIQTGIYGHALNGTTLTMSKKGSKLSTIVNPCIDAFLKTESYYNICSKHELTGSCYQNEFFGKIVTEPKPWSLATSEHPEDNCAAGYCSCAA